MHFAVVVNIPYPNDRLLERVMAKFNGSPDEDSGLLVFENCTEDVEEGYKEADRKKYPTLKDYAKWAGYDYCSDDCIGVWENPEGKWDWWQKGGRWTGYFNKEYNPETDEANKVFCEYCEGTGTRKDFDGKTCNACYGTGKRLQWPTEWVDEFNSAQVKDVNLDELEMPCALVSLDGKWTDLEYFYTSKEEKEKFDLISKEAFEEWKSKLNPETYLVIVDCHY